MIDDSNDRRRRAETYEERRFGKRRRIDRWEKDRARDVVSRAGADAHLLDAPCGSGRFAEIFRPLRRLTLIDLSPEMLAVGRARVEGHPHAAAIRADLTAIPLADGSVDVAWCMRLFHHLPTDEIRRRVLSELARVTRRLVAMTFYNARSGRHGWRRWTGRRIRGRSTTYANVVRLAAAAGLRVVERRPRINWVDPQCFVLLEKA